MGIVRRADDMKIAQYFQCWDQVEIYPVVRVTDGWDWRFLANSSLIFSRPLHGLFRFRYRAPAINRWAILTRSASRTRSIFVFWAKLITSFKLGLEQNRIAF